LAAKAGVDCTNYKERAVQERKRREDAHEEKVALESATPHDENDAGYLFYQKLLTIMRDKKPLLNADTCPPRSPRPM
jgi:hypothetical protein